MDNLLVSFIEEKCFYVAGSMVEFSRFYDMFLEWLERGNFPGWSKRMTSKALPEQFPCGGWLGNRKYIGNISLEPAESNAEPVRLEGGRLKKYKPMVGRDEIISEIQQLHDQGYSYDRITKWLNQNGKHSPYGKAWTVPNLYQFALRHCKKPASCPNCGSPIKPDDKEATD